MDEEQREKREEGFSSLVRQAIERDKPLRCLGFDVTLTPNELKNLDSVTRSFYSRCKWLIVNG